MSHTNKSARTGAADCCTENTKDHSHTHCVQCISLMTLMIDDWWCDGVLAWWCASYDVMVMVLSMFDDVSCVHSLNQSSISRSQLANRSYGRRAVPKEDSRRHWNTAKNLWYPSCFVNSFSPPVMIVMM